MSSCSTDSVLILCEIYNYGRLSRCDRGGLFVITCTYVRLGIG